ncbi:zinc finger with UFM1-specific peptidase domain protein [Fusarium tjaetaba]|uniref:Zinc finger with UFM1-specific peptidase domain protein n=1 Tax=Fusarium tjaetaba TaxID=1567544 RepID=A0A8H5RVJ2_9HYPO|nr:zinc finger with UFM1-specific peptidase domain protein [Fusarium tjaetaba]KAF5639202.1 zinc finger with UFM1-specific peptidase domain protein [Fusarium tjaetaba]
MSNSDPCPFCGFKPGQDEYELILHIEQQHPDADGPPPTNSGDTIECPEGCGEILRLDELAYHLELHELEAQDATPMPEPAPVPEPEQTPTVARKPESSSRDRDRKHKKVSPIQAWKDLFSGRSSHGRESNGSSSRTRHKTKREDAGITKTASRGSSSRDKNGDRAKSNVRLGKSDLGRFAHERKMPPWLVDLLKDEGQVVNDGVLPVLSQLLEQSPSTQEAYLCHPAVQHVSKLRREGGFCGYRNIQMLTSNIIAAPREGSNHFGRTFPTIFQIQDLIENAWDIGINAQGRAETGGIKGTRKYIGTPEAQAVFLSLEIPCSVQAFKDQERGKSKQRLFEAIEGYFRGGITSVEDRIHHTDLPPIYLQHPGHSLTIVGFEKQMDGQANLLVFDPSFRDSTKVRNLIGRTVRQKPSSVDSFLQPYRRGSHYFRKYNQYEVLYLTKYATVS